MKMRQILFVSTALMLGACTTTEPKLSRPLNVIPYVNIPMSGVSVGCLSHKGAPYVSSFSVEEFFSKRMVGGLSCGGIGALGYTLPDTWQPGMKVKVRWKPNARDWIEKTTTIRRYEEAGTLYVHFFENDEVRVVSSAGYAPESPKHPILKSSTIAPPEEE
ncbi:DUF3304 domain-containing protein [Glaciimonas sp. GG7]